MYKAMAHIHSKNGKLEEVTVISNRGDNSYVVKTSDGVVCTAIYNPFDGAYYADDKYSVWRQVL